MSVLSIMDRTFNLSVRCLSVRWGVIVVVLIVVAIHKGLVVVDKSLSDTH